MDLQEVEWDSIDMALGRDSWRALVNTLMNLPFP